MAERALLDTGVLVAFLHRGDRAHAAALAALRAFRGTLLTTEAVLTESTYLLSRLRGGAAACLEFFLRGGAVLVPSSRASLARSKALLETYADLPADFADVSLVTLAEETGTRLVITRDRRDFSMYRPQGGRRFDVRP